jgi:hypothetical protein
VGDTKAGSKARRAGSGYRRRAVGTRDKIISHLALVSDVADDTGMASTRLAEAVDYPGSSVAFAQLLSGMERDGLIAREVRGKRTYRITLTAQGEQRQREGGADAASGLGGVRGNGTGRSRGAGTSRVGAGRGTGTRLPGSASVLGRGGLADSADVFPTDTEFDYDELARRLLVQVVRRLSANPGELTGAQLAADPAIEETVAGLDRELATAWTRHGTLTAENMKLRQQLREAQRDLELERRSRRRPVTDELNRAEAVLLDRLLSPADEPGASAG